MRKQVVEIFSEWLEYYLGHKEECADGENACHQWVETNHPEATEEVVKAVADSFKRTPEALCSWEFTQDKVLNIIIKQPQNNNQNE